MTDRYYCDIFIDSRERDIVLYFLEVLLFSPSTILVGVDFVETFVLNKSERQGMEYTTSGRYETEGEAFIIDLL